MKTIITISVSLTVIFLFTQAIFSGKQAIPDMCINAAEMVTVEEYHVLQSPKNPPFTAVLAALRFLQTCSNHPTILDIISTSFYKTVWTKNSFGRKHRPSMEKLRQTVLEILVPSDKNITLTVGTSSQPCHLFDTILLSYPNISFMDTLFFPKDTVDTHTKLALKGITRYGCIDCMAAINAYIDDSNYEDYRDLAIKARNVLTQISNEAIRKGISKPDAAIIFDVEPMTPDIKQTPDLTPYNPMFGLAPDVKESTYVTIVGSPDASLEPDTPPSLTERIDQVRDKVDPEEEEEAVEEKTTPSTPQDSELQEYYEPDNPFETPPPTPPAQPQSPTNKSQMNITAPWDKSI